LLIGATVNDKIPLKDVEGFDPFLPEETDPAKTNAIKSSLWEMQTMSNHYLPAVSRLTKIFQGDFDKKLYPLDDFLDESYQSVRYTLSDLFSNNL
jgi:hypothetical protein